MKIVRTSPSRERKLGVVVAGLCLAWFGCIAFSASADEVEGVAVKVAQKPSCAESVEAKNDESRAGAIIGPDVNWENQRQIPITSPFVTGTGYWGPSLHADAD